MLGLMGIFDATVIIRVIMAYGSTEEGRVGGGGGRWGMGRSEK